MTIKLKNFYVSNISNNRKILFFTVSAFILVTFLVIMFVLPKENPTKNEFLLAEMMDPILKELDVENSRGGFKLYADNGEANVVGVSRDIVEDSKVKDFILALSGLKLSAITHENSEAKYGVLEPEANVSGVFVSNRAGQKEKVFELQVGGKAPANLGRYARLSDKGVVCIIPSDVANYFCGSQLDFVSDYLFQNTKNKKIPHFSLEFLVLKSGDSIKLTKYEKHSTLRLEKDGRQLLLSEGARNCVERLLDYRAQNVKRINPTTEELSGFGLFEPYAQFTLNIGEKKEIVKISEPNDGLCYVLCNQGQVVLECNAEGLMFLNCDVEDLHKKKIVEEQGSDIESFEIKMLDKTLFGKRENNVWQLNVAKEGTVNPIYKVLVEDILGAINKFDLNESKNLKLEDDKSPNLSFKIYYNNQETDEYEFFELSSNRACIVAKPGSLYFDVSAEAMIELSDLVKNAGDI